VISIRRRLTGWLLVGLFVILMTGGAIFYLSVRSVLLSEFDFADEHMPSFERKDRPEYFQIWIGDAAVEGESIERSESLDGTDLPDRTGPMDSPEFWDLPLPGELPGRAVGIRFRPENESADVRSENFIRHERDVVRLVIAKERTDLDGSLRAIGVTLLAVGTAILIFTALIVGFVVRLGLRPLDALGGRVGTIDAWTLSERLPAESMPVELRPICARLNELLARLEDSFRRERRFSANVAHELRTPIAELRSLAEVALKYPGDAGACATAF